MSEARRHKVSNLNHSDLSYESKLDAAFGESDLNIRLGKFRRTINMSNVSPACLKENGIRDGGFYVPVSIDSFSVGDLTFPWIGGLCFPFIDDSGAIFVGAMYFCGGEAMPEHKAEQIVSLVTKVAESKIKKLVVEAYKAKVIDQQNNY